MVISAFEWDDANIEHIQRHNFSPDEAEEVLSGECKVRRTRERRYIALGETLDGRLAFLVFQRLPKGWIRVITARDMEPREKRLFHRK